MPIQVDEPHKIETVMLQW